MREGPPVQRTILEFEGAPLQSWTRLHMSVEWPFNLERLRVEQNDISLFLFIEFLEVSSL